jgi:hypothetical protein
MAYDASRYFAPRYFAPRYFDTDAVTSGFPTQYAGLHVFNASVIELCLVAVADAPSGDVIKVRKNSTDYALYLVDVGDTYASPVRVNPSEGIKAVRLKT